jgi:hypothetical protein
MEPPLLTCAPMGGPRDIAPPPVVPLVLQISPLPGSSDREEFFYDHSLDNGHGPITAAHKFFLGQGHEVIVHACPDISAFQAAHLFAITLCPLGNLPPHVFTKGYARLQELAIAVAVAALEFPPAPTEGIALDDLCTSLINCYVDIPSSVSLLVVSWPPVQPSGPTPAVGAFPGLLSVAGASYGGSHPSRRPDPEGFNIGTSLHSSL